MVLCRNNCKLRNDQFSGSGVNNVSLLETLLIEETCSQLHLQARLAEIAQECHRMNESWGNRVCGVIYILHLQLVP